MFFGGAVVFFFVFRIFSYLLLHVTIHSLCGVSSRKLFVFCKEYEKLDFIDNYTQQYGPRWEIILKLDRWRTNFSSLSFFATETAFKPIFTFLIRVQHQYRKNYAGDAVLLIAETFIFKLNQKRNDSYNNWLIFLV